MYRESVQHLPHSKLHKIVTVPCGSLHDHHFHFLLPSDSLSFGVVMSVVPTELLDISLPIHDTLHSPAFPTKIKVKFTIPNLTP